MSNIFKLTDDFKQIIDMADQLDPQTLEDTLEALGELTADKVAKTIAVMKSIEGEISVAKEYKKDLEQRIKTMEATQKRLSEYIQLGVETVGKPKKGAEQFRKLEIKDHPWVKSVWTQYNPPSVEVVNLEAFPENYLVPQPPKADSKKIAADWKKKMSEYEARRNAFILEMETLIQEGQIDEEKAAEAITNFEEQNKPKIPGVEINQTIGVRFR